MMIRINLLPVRQAAKRESGRQFLVASIGFIAIASAASFYWWYTVDGDKQAAERKLADTQVRIDELEKKIGEVNNINKQKKEVEAKLKTLDDLRKKRGGPVKLLDALSTAIPKKVWINDFVEGGGAVVIHGQGESHEDVSDFMKGLTSVVWTPKGMGRVLERKNQAATARVELLTGDGAIEDFPVSQLGTFFTGVELKSSEVEVVGANKRVKFEITLSANYAI